MAKMEQSDPPLGSTQAIIRFVLSGLDIEVDYLAAEAPQLRHRVGGAERVFTAQELRIERTALGTLATGTLESVPDLSDLTVTLAVPDVNVGEGGSANVNTFLVRTRHSTSIGGPALVDGALQAYETVALTGTATAAEQTAAGRCEDWQAVHDLEPPTPGWLRATGRCTLPSPGHRVELRRKEPQGINPADLLLERVVHQPTTPAAQVLTEVEVEYGEQTEAQIDTVTILPDGVSIPVQRAL